MREKAKNSLEKLQDLRPQRNYVTINNNITSAWHKCDVRPHESRIDLIEWANKKCLGRFSRDWNSYYFENERDAFAFQLKWGG